MMPLVDLEAEHEIESGRGVPPRRLRRRGKERAKKQRRGRGRRRWGEGDATEMDCMFVREMRGAERFLFFVVLANR